MAQACAYLYAVTVYMDFLMVSVNPVNVEEDDINDTGFLSVADNYHPQIFIDVIKRLTETPQSEICENSRWLYEKFG